MNKTVYTDAVLGESCHSVTLPNGLKIFVSEKKNFKTCYAVFGTKYGSIDTEFSRDGKAFTKVPEGIAHYLEHKLFESEDGDAFTRYSKTGANANAFTSFDRTCYLFSCADRFYDNLEILLDFVQTPYFTEQTVKKEQGIIGQEIRMYDDSAPWCVLFNMLSAMYESHPVRIDIAGTVQSIAEINADLLYECYNTFYNPSNMFVCIAGSLNADEVIDYIEKSVKPSPATEIIRRFPPEPDGVLKPYVEKEMPVAKPIFCFGFKEQCDGERTLRESVLSELLIEIIAGEASPLYEKMVQSGLINDEFDSEYFQGNGYATPIWQGESNDPGAVAEEIKGEVSRLKKEGIDEELFESVRRTLYGAAIKRYNTVDAIVMNLVDCAMDGTGPYDDVDILRSVTKSDVEERLTLLREDNTVLSVILPKRV